jgi:excisionase family DNA binding protein
MTSETITNMTMFNSYKDVVGVDELCLMLNGISRKLAYKLLKNGEIQSIRIGREYKIPKIKVIEYLLGHEHIEKNAEI